MTRRGADSDPHQTVDLTFVRRVLDGAVVAGTLFAVCTFYGVHVGPAYLFAGSLAVLVFLFAAEVTRLYAAWPLSSLRQQSVQVLVVWTTVAAALVVIAFLTKTSATYSRLAVGTWLIACAVLLVFGRLLLRSALRRFARRGNHRPLAIVGANAAATLVADRLLNAPALQVELVGFFEDGVSVGLSVEARQEYRVQGDLAALVAMARSGAVHYVYIALPMREEERIRNLINALSDTTASVCLVPDMFVFEMMQARWTVLEGIPVVTVFDEPFDGINGSLKRCEDLVLASVILTIIAIPMLLIAVGVKLTSPGKVFFKQRRYGLNGQVVEVWKFRTMRVTEDGENIVQAQRSDPRVTPFGNFLRRTSLDELPQFLNVIFGSMSIVGPRPHAVAHNEQYRCLIPGYMLRHKVKPGITGWAQIKGWRGETETLDKMQKRVDCDLEYIRNWSLWLDIKIVVITVFKGFIGGKAY